MAFSAANLLNQTCMPPGKNRYRYDVDGSVDDVDDVEAANYFNNRTGNSNLAIGDLIDVLEWSSTPFAAGSTLTNALQLVVTNVIATSGSTGGQVNTAQIYLTTSLFSSLL